MSPTSSAPARRRESARPVANSRSTSRRIDKPKAAKRAQASRPRRAEKWVYLLLRGQRVDEGAARRQGREPRRDDALGLPVPPGFIVTTQACNAYLAAGGFAAGHVGADVAALAKVEHATGKRFGDPRNPLLVSCRSGARFSMPGMMDTVLNIGLNDEVAQGLAQRHGRRALRLRRLPPSRADVRHGRAGPAGRAVRGKCSRATAPSAAWPTTPTSRPRTSGDHRGIQGDREGPHAAVPSRTIRSRSCALAAEAVFKSWNGKRAIDYRNAAGIAHDLGTAVNIQTMVFGNLGADSGTGVVTTRNVTTGEPEIEGDWLINAQGEDVVAGTRATQRDRHAGRRDAARSGGEFARDLHASSSGTAATCRTSSSPIERGKLWMLQTRDAKRTAQAAVRIAVDLADERLHHARGGRAARHAGARRLLPASAVRSGARCARRRRRAAT